LAQEVMDSGVAGGVAMRYDIYLATPARFVADLHAGLVPGPAFGPAASAARRNPAARPPRAHRGTGHDRVGPRRHEAVPLHLTSKPASNDHAEARPGPQAGPVSGHRPGDTLPARPSLGFCGRDNTLLALDRAFDTQPIVLLHGQTGIGKTATAAEFAR